MRGKRVEELKLTNKREMKNGPSRPQQKEVEKKWKCGRWTRKTNRPPDRKIRKQGQSQNA